MIEKLSLSLIIMPALAGLAIILFQRKMRLTRDLLTLAGAAANLFIAFSLFKSNAAFSMPWAGFGFEFSFRLYHFSAFTILASAGFGFLVILYSIVFMRERINSSLFFGLLLMSLALVNGAALSDNLIMLLFFWEGLLITLWGMIAIGNKDAFRTATKMFIIIGISDLCMMAGIAICGHIAGTLTISKISIAASGFGGLAFILMVTGAIAKAGSMPFHTWIPDAAIDAPLPFMAIFPGALEKLLGIYFLTRISLDIFRLTPDSWASFAMMTVGAITILGAVMMALVQKDYKRLLAYHAVSQVGYMILGIGTLVPIGIVGGLFHMINNALYKSCLFLTGGSVERQAGTTDLEQLGGLGKMMPVTFICFLITAASISGVPPFNGFFSKELIYDGALERGMIFYVAAALGSFLTAASFLKLGHAAFMGKSNRNDVKEAPLPMLIPMVVIAASCVLFGVWNALPINKLIQPILGARLEGHNFAGWPANSTLVMITVITLIAALLNHLYGVKRTGSSLKAADHIHYAPGLRTIYEYAEKGRLDPYNIGMGSAGIFAACCRTCDRAVDWVYNVFTPAATGAITGAIRNLHDGSYKTYIIWSIATTAIIVLFLLK
ncbi:MAG: proton-conducting transporter membrane subunit [Candidatus Omnitrophica bacterium]|nr:proton-conducting transporter membrane subunit [Candidatus Omnitrophota bacterium]